MPKVSVTQNSSLHSKILIICGPTATGKTALAISLAKKFNGEIINADSRQMYCGLSVLTGKDISPNAKPTVHTTMKFHEQLLSILSYELSGIPLWLYDITEGNIDLSIAAYTPVAKYVIADILSRGKLPIIVGGSGLYLRAITEHIDTIHVPKDVVLRNRFAQSSVEDMQHELSNVDIIRLESMNNSDRNNPRRLIRAIEVGIWKKHHTENTIFDSFYDYYWIGLTRSQEEMQSLIAQRVKKRWQSGVIKEVKEMNIRDTRLPLATSLGIEPIIQYINGKLTDDEAKQLWIKKEMSYAKRQMTWFVKCPAIRWFDAGDCNLIQQVETCVDSWYT